MDPDGQPIILGYGDDGMSPTFYFWKHGLVSEEH